MLHNKCPNKKKINPKLSKLLRVKIIKTITERMITLKEEVQIEVAIKIEEEVIKIDKTEVATSKDKIEVVTMTDQKEEDMFKEEAIEEAVEVINNNLMKNTAKLTMNSMVKKITITRKINNTMKKKINTQSQKLKMLSILSKQKVKMQIVRKNKRQ